MADAGMAAAGRRQVRHHEQKQLLCSYRLAFRFATDAGILEYLRDKEFTVEDVPFRAQYFHA
jgi:23S rRNA pseudouridine955/2504/2580 synthase